MALRRRFRPAFDLPSVLRLVCSSPKPYAEAWLVSLAVSALAVLTGPFAPWMLFWSYLVISHVFLQALAAWPTAEVRNRMRRVTWTSDAGTRLPNAAG